MKRVSKFFIVTLLLLTGHFGYSQEVSVSGNITAASDSMPLAGVSIVVKGTTTGTQTDFDGNYSLEVDSQATLVYSYIGFANKEVAVNGQTSINVILDESSESLDEVVVLGYSTRKKTTLTASVSSISGVELIDTPVPTVSGAVGGRVSGVITTQGSGEPGLDETTIRIRGVGTVNNADALVIIDGIERNISSINARDIETFTILKDAASVAPYGLKGANGVVLITTKRGLIGKTSFNYSTTYGLQTPTALPKIANSFTWASLKNQAFLNDGGDPTNLPFTQEQLNNFRNGTGDPNRFANENVLDLLIDEAPIQNHNLEVRGGTEKFKYFASLGFLDQEANWGRATNFQRYNITSNVDFQISESTKFGIDFQGSLSAQERPALGSFLDPDTQIIQSGAGSEILFDFYRINSTNPIFLNGDRSTPAGYFERNPFLDINESGTFGQDDYRYALTIRLEHKLKAIPGLTLRANLAIDKRDVETKIFTTPYTFFQLENDNTLSPFTGNVPSPTLEEAYGRSRQITGQLIANYQKQWGKHSLDGLFVFEPRDGTNNPAELNKFFSVKRNNFATGLSEISTSGNSNPADLSATGFSTNQRQVGYASRATYDFDKKYILEVAGRYDGHYFFAPGNRFAFFPSASAAWRVSEEPFFKSNLINNLKIRGSWGKSGSLAGLPFQFLSQFQLRNNTFAFGSGTVSSAEEALDPNPNISWEKATKHNLGIEMDLFNSELGIEFDIFYDKRTDVLINTSAVIPNEFGIGIGQENNGEIDNRGFDFSIRYKHDFSDNFGINAGVTYSYAKNEIISIAENAATFDDPVRRRTGNSILPNDPNTPSRFWYGLKSLGYFQTQAEIDATPYATALGNLQPGDVKYDDRNGDGVLNNLDNVPLGDSPDIPLSTYGITLGAHYKNFSLSTLWQGATGTTRYLDDTFAAQPFTQGNGVVFESHLDFWTPENPNAAYPRLTGNPGQGGTGNNYLRSTHWIRNANYLRLKNIVLAYKLKDIIGLNSIRLYASGQNLLTFTKLDDIIDPESPNGFESYWTQKTIALGLDINF